MPIRYCERDYDESRAIGRQKHEPRLHLKFINIALVMEAVFALNVFLEIRRKIEQVVESVLLFNQFQ